MGSSSSSLQLFSQAGSCSAQSAVFIERNASHQFGLLQRTPLGLNNQSLALLIHANAAGASVQRMYWAIIENVPGAAPLPDSGEINAAIGPAASGSTPLDGAKPASTRFQVIARHPLATWLQLQPSTGRPCSMIGVAPPPQPVLTQWLADFGVFLCDRYPTAHPCVLWSSSIQAALM